MVLLDEFERVDRSDRARAIEWLTQRREQACDEAVRIAQQQIQATGSTQAVNSEPRAKRDGKRGKNAKREIKSEEIEVIDARSSARGLKFLISENGRNRWVYDDLLAEQARHAVRLLICLFNHIAKCYVCAWSTLFTKLLQFVLVVCLRTLSHDQQASMR